MRVSFGMLNVIRIKCKRGGTLSSLGVISIECPQVGVNDINDIVSHVLHIQSFIHSYPQWLMKWMMCLG